MDVFDEAMTSARYPLRGLITCAGILRVGDATTFPMQDLKDIMEINTIGTFTCAQAAARIVHRQKVPASFVFIASMSAYVANRVSGSLPDDS